MKTKTLLFIYVCLFILFTIKLQAQTNIFPSTGSAGIGTTTPNASSLLEIKSTNKGLLIPRMTQAQRNAITSPATGLMIYQTNATPGFYYYGGNGWKSVAAKAWNLTGNAGTDSTINFIGTTDAHPLVFKVNNIRAGFIGYSTSNTSFGYQALISNTTGNYNTATGLGALTFNTTGSNNTANGYKALYSNINGVRNVVIGDNAMYSSTSGSYNTAVGSSSLNENTTGSFNSAVGLDALGLNTTGNNNTATGTYALENNTTGKNNSAHGMYALFNNTTGYSNIAMTVRIIQQYRADK